MINLGQIPRVDGIQRDAPHSVLWTERTPNSFPKTSNSTQDGTAGRSPFSDTQVTNSNPRKSFYTPVSSVTRSELAAYLLSQLKHKTGTPLQFRHKPWSA